MKIKEYLIDNYLLNPEDKINLFFFIGPDAGLTDQRVKTLCKTLRIDKNNPFNVSHLYKSSDGLYHPCCYISFQPAAKRMIVFKPTTEQINTINS